jgi:hypothetical protein
MKSSREVGCDARPPTAKAKPPGVGTLGGSCLETRQLKARGGHIGGMGTRARAVFKLAAPPGVLPLPFGGTVLHLGMRQIHWTACDCPAIKTVMEKSYKVVSLNGGSRPWSGRPATEPKYLLGTYSDPILAAS